MASNFERKSALRYGKPVNQNTELQDLRNELKDLEKTQLEVGEQMAELTFQQVRLAEKTRAILVKIEKLTG